MKLLSRLAVVGALALAPGCCPECPECPVDADTDGYTEEQGDCDDGDPARNPGAVDLCDGVDTDCDGVVDDDTIVVDPSGGGDAATIQEGLGLAIFGDTVCVLPGTYPENLLLEGGSVTLQALAGPSATTIDGGGQGSTLLHTFGDSSTVIGFTITGGSGTPFDPDQDGTAQPCGGGVYVAGSSVTLVDVVITGNTAEEGGGIYATEGTLTLESVVVADNEATGPGGGIRLRQTGTAVQLSDSEVRDNVADLGGGLSLYQSAPTLLNTAVRGNEAIDKGGAMYVGTGSGLTLSGCAITDNVAGTIGGALRLYQSQAFLGGSDISGNVAGDVGGGVACRKATFSLGGATITDNEPDDVFCDECEGCADS